MLILRVCNPTERRVETGDRSNAAFHGADAAQEIFAANANAGDRTDACNDCTTSCHLEGVVLFAGRSRYVFMQRNVLPAMWWMKKLPIMGSAIGASRRF